jgi:hypothetical protein
MVCTIWYQNISSCNPKADNMFIRGQFKCDGTHTETRFCLSAKQMSPFKLVVVSVQSTTGSWGVCISGSNAGCSMVVWRVLATHSIRRFPRHFPSRASPCAITFQLESTSKWNIYTYIYVITLNLSHISYQWKKTPTCNLFHSNILWQKKEGCT